MYEYLLLLVLLGAMIFSVYLRYQYHTKLDNMKKTFKKTIHGLFINLDKKEGSHFFSKIYKDNSIIFRHKQGTTSDLDEEWKKTGDNVYQISSTSASIILSKKYALIDNDTIRVYEDDQLVETLIRNNEECYYGETVEPTYENFKQLYDLVEVRYDQADELEKIIERKKACATINDVHVHTGISSNLYMARGMFAIDKRRTCFYYVPRDMIPILLYQVEELKPLLLDVKEFEKAGFIGAMN